MTTNERNTMQANVSFVLNFTDAPGEQEQEIMLLDHFTMLTDALGERCVSAGWNGPTSGAINLHERLRSEPAAESPAVSPEAKQGVTPPGAGTGAVVPEGDPNAGPSVPTPPAVDQAATDATPAAPATPATLDLPAPPTTTAPADTGRSTGTND